MEIVTGYKGQPHITAENCADLNRGIVGSDSYVLSVGRRFEAELVSNNLLKIRDGTALIQGRQFVIPSGQSDEITIENGTQGENRTDLVVARYTKNNDTKVEEVTPVYIKGTPSASDPALPEYNEDGDIRAGDLTADMPLYALDLEGINVVAVRPLFNILESAAQLNSKMLVIKTGTVVISANSKTNGTKKINFDGFTEVPEVFASLNNSWVDTAQVSAYNETLTGATIAVYNGSTSNSATFPVNWMAVGV